MSCAPTRMTSRVSECKRAGAGAATARTAAPVCGSHGQNKYFMRAQFHAATKCPPLDCGVASGSSDKNCARSRSDNGNGLIKRMRTQRMPPWSRQISAMAAASAALPPTALMRTCVTPSCVSASTIATAISVGATAPDDQSRDAPCNGNSGATTAMPCATSTGIVAACPIS